MLYLSINTMLLAKLRQRAGRRCTFTLHLPEPVSVGAYLLCSLLVLLLVDCLLPWHWLCLHPGALRCPQNLPGLPGKRPNMSPPSVRSLWPCRGPALWLQWRPQILHRINVAIRRSDACALRHHQPYFSMINLLSSSMPTASAVACPGTCCFVHTAICKPQREGLVQRSNCCA